MPIDLQCGGCGRALWVADEHATVNVQCPDCRAVVEVPSGRVMSGETYAAAQSDRPPRRADNVPAAPPQPQWRVRIPEGKAYGPIPLSELNEWVAEGRLDRGCEVKREGFPLWQSAAEVFPALAEIAAPPPPRLEPHEVPDDAPPRIAHAHVKAHRGPLLLTLGIVSLVLGVMFCFCMMFLPVNVLGPITWLLARKDLREIREGTMDPAGQGPTGAAHVLSIIATVLLAIQFVAFLVYAALILFGVLAGGAFTPFAPPPAPVPPPPGG